MTNILQALAVAATLITVTVAGTSSVLAGSGSPYPEQFKIRIPHPSVGGQSGIPAPYRLGD